MLFIPSVFFFTDLFIIGWFYQLLKSVLKASAEIVESSFSHLNSVPVSLVFTQRYFVFEHVPACGT